MNNNLVYGLGIYKSGKHTSRDKNGLTKAYRRWKDILSRCQPDGTIQTKYPTYIGCSLHQDFIQFQDFAEWYYKQPFHDSDGYHLDKDILSNGSKTYSPSTCAFIPASLNNLLTHRKNGSACTGIRLLRSGRYRVQIRSNGVLKNVGDYTTMELATQAYADAKELDIRSRANVYVGLVDDRIIDKLKTYKM